MENTTVRIKTFKTERKHQFLLQINEFLIGHDKKKFK